MQKDYRILIISNNPISNKGANGKTMYSFIDCLPKDRISQLYFNSQKPTIEGYNYFQLSDKDIIKGMFAPRKRGRVIVPSTTTETTSSFSSRTRKIYESFRLIRELLWWKKWKSNHLMRWLESINPTSIILVGGDSCFAYDICSYIRNKFDSDLTLFLTDDYILPRSDWSLAGAIRRRIIKRKIESILRETKHFLTISEVMKQEYKKVFGHDSSLAVNIPDKVKDDSIEMHKNDRIELIYAGSLNYGRDYILRLIGEQIEEYNRNTPDNKAILKIYTGTPPSEKQMKTILIPEASTYCGSLGRDELNRQLNIADILVFVESFDKKQIEKTRLSLSTKIPEYLSAGKPILAVGPSNIGSINYLKGISALCGDKTSIKNVIFKLLDDSKYRKELANLAYDQYLKYHVKEIAQKRILSEILSD